MKDQYSGFGYLYDIEMSGREMKKKYKKWVNIAKKAAKENGIKVNTVVDLACGTGNTTVLWLDTKARIIGVDLSESMLKEARKKSKRIEWIKGDITKLKLNVKADVVTCFYDAINHILTKKGWQSVFNNVYKILNERGVFVFDVNTENAFKWLNGREKLFEFKDMLFFASNSYKNKIATFRQIWFIKKGKLYERRELRVKERTFSDSEIREMLKKSGFKKIKSLVLDKRENKVSRVMYVGVKIL